MPQRIKIYNIPGAAGDYGPFVAHFKVNDTECGNWDSAPFLFELPSFQHNGYAASGYALVSASKGFSTETGTLFMKKVIIPHIRALRKKYFNFDRNEAPPLKKPKDMLVQELCNELELHGFVSTGNKETR